MLRIPTGKVPKNTARTISILLGVGLGLASYFWPQHADALQKAGIGLGALGTALGGSK